MRTISPVSTWIQAFAALACTNFALAAENWPQFQFDSRRSGNVTDRQIEGPLTLAAAVPLSDAIFTAPAVADGRVYIVDGSGVAYCFEVGTLRQIWKTPTDGGSQNVNNVSSPAVVDGYVHFGTTAGNFYVLKASDGSVVRKIACGDPIFSSPVVRALKPLGGGKDEQRSVVYFATLGGRLHRIAPNGEPRWTWDFVREVLKFPGDRWNGEAWAAHKKSRVTWREQFCVSREIAADNDTLVVPAGGTIVWLEDRGDKAELAAGYAPNESPATLGLSVGEDGAVYRQWYRRDNGGSVEVLRRDGKKVAASVVDGTQTAYNGAGSMSFSSVALRDGDVYRTRPEEGFGLVRHAAGKKPTPLGAYPSIAPPVLVGNRALVSGLDGVLYAVRIDESDAKNDAWSFKTPFARPITAPAVVADGHVYFGGEDGYLYALRKGGEAAPPSEELKLATIRSPLSSPLSDAKYDWFTNFGDLANTNRVEQDLAPPFKMRWIRRVEGTVKHLSVCGGGRSYTHTAEGQIWAVEQETGRLLWRTYYPGVHVSYTAPIYHDGRLLIPQAGLRESWLRCLDAATGKLLWKVPFSGSPSWNRQLPPLVHEGRVFYCYSSGRYDEKQWLFEHQNTFGFPDGHRPLVKCWDLKSGEEIWSLDFSEHGAGGDDAGLCLMDGMLYYSAYFGNKKPPGVTAAIEPATGKVRWRNTEYAVHGGCTISAKDGRLYLGGYNAVGGKTNHIWCLDARDGSLVWKSDPVGWAIHVVTIAPEFVFTHAQYKHGCLLDREAGRKLCDLTQGYNCTRFTMAGPYLIGANMDIYDTSKGNALVSTGPAVDVLLCVGAHMSNGRIYFTGNGGGLQLSLSQGDEARRFTPAWEAGGK